MSLRIFRTVSLSAFALSLNACSASSSAPQPAFWDPANPTIYSKLTGEQEAAGVRLARDFIALLDLLKDLASEEKAQLATLRTSDLATSLPEGDGFTVTEIILRCERRTTVSQLERGVHFVSREGQVCPVEFSGGLHTVQGPFQGGIAGKRELGIGFSAKPGTVIFDQGSIRAFTLKHIERTFERPRKNEPPTPGQRWIDKKLGGTLTVKTGERVPFSIKRLVSLSIAKLDDTREAWTGRDETTVTLSMPTGALVVTTDSIYDGRSASPATRVTVNGRDVSK